MTAIPTPENMDAAWFTRCLSEAGYPGTVVSDVARTRIGTGQIGKCVRFNLAFEGATNEGAPRSLVGKFPSDDDISRATGVGLRNYYREIMFYRHLAAALTISVPRCFYAAIEGEGPEFALVLEDMTPAVPGNQLVGCDAAVARAAVLELVGLQAPSWCREDLRGHDWLAGASDAAASHAAYRQMLPGFLERYGERLAADERAIIARVGESPGCPLFQPAGRPFCLEHVDYRLDNMLIDARSGSAPAVTVVDWQSVRLGKPLNDVAYFLGAGLVPRDRRPVEADIVREYHEGLMAAGITDYDWDRCWQDYRRGSFAGFGVTVVASMIVEQTERGDDMFTVMAQRHARHALDLGAEAFLD